MSVDGSVDAMCAKIAKHNAFMSWLSLSIRDTILISCPCKRERLPGAKVSRILAPMPEIIT